MKKICLTLGAALVGLSGFASTRILYQQNFETVESPEAAGWSYGGASMTIASDEYGKFLQLSLGQNNGRSGQVTWGQEIFVDENGDSILEDGIYTVSFDFSIQTMSNNQYNSEITLFTNHTPIANNTYRIPWTAPLGPWNTYVFDLSQCNTSADADMLATVNAPLVGTEGEDGAITYTISDTESYSFVTGDWYTVTCEVNTNTRVVEYSIISTTGGTPISGEFTVPEKSLNADEDEVSMFVEGMFVMTARYATIIDIDNIEVSCETSYPYANPPTIALTGLGTVTDADGEQVEDLNARTYTITFLEGETLNVQDASGTTVEVDYYDCEGAYVYATTTSGTLKAWTTSEGVESTIVEVEADCTPCVLPTAEATISSVVEGYGKTYTLTVSNSEVPLQPTIFMNYEFKGVNGETLAENGVASGATVTVSEEGTLTVTTAAFGYQSASVEIKNDLEFVTKNVYDFARMSKEELQAAGFTDWQQLNSDSMSGFSNWTARKRLYYNLAGSETIDEETGSTVYTAVYPFGYVSEDGPVLNYSEIGTEGDDLGINVAGYELFPGVSVFAGHNVTVLEHVGVTNNATTGGNYKNIDVYNLAQTDFVVLNTIGSYGSDSNHPICATDDEYYAQLTGTDTVYSVAESGTLDEETNTYTVSLPVYRIDTVATMVTIYAQKGESGVETVEAVENNDPWYYTIDGLRVAEPTRPGLYIHKGKKIIVK